MLSAAELARYGRQLALPDVGLVGQERLRGARILVVGAGGLGSPVILYLAAAGVGVIGIVDNDDVEPSNLHRQVLHGTADIGREKTASAADAIRQLNPHVEVRVHQERLTDARALILLRDYDILIDGSDNFSTRYAINDACAQLGRVWIYGSVERFSGQVSIFGAPGGPCYRCIFPEPPASGSTASCEEIGVLGAVPGVIGALQATEALKWILGVGEPLVGRLLQLDLKNGTARTVSFERREDCLCCTRAEQLEGAPMPQESPVQAPFDIEPIELSRALAGSQSASVHLLDIREPWEWSVARIGDPQMLAMGDLEEQVASLDPERELVVYCHHGVRSSVAAEWLRARGFRARNLAGGIDRWSREIDPSVARY
jgi:molybdopterin/thiamine biosynthesis adenylyltransferase/rhodanese-related sulfurtransferase